jgi:hypothetical protein
VYSSPTFLSQTSKPEQLCASPSLIMACWY